MGLQPGRRRVGLVGMEPHSRTVGIAGVLATVADTASGSGYDRLVEGGHNIAGYDILDLAGRVETLLAVVVDRVPATMNKYESYSGDGADEDSLWISPVEDTDSLHMANVLHNPVAGEGHHTVMVVAVVHTRSLVVAAGKGIHHLLRLHYNNLDSTCFCCCCY